MPEPILVTIPRACLMLGIGRTKFYEIVNAGQIDTRRVGARRLVSVASLKAFAASLPTWAEPVR